MPKILEKLYFFTKLSSSILLLVVVSFFIFMFSRAYFDIEFSEKNEAPNEIQQLSNNINKKLNENNESVNKLLKKINEIENDLETIKKNNNINLKKDLNKLSNDLDELKNKNIAKPKKNILIDEKKFLIKKYIKSIQSSIEKGEEFNTSVIEMQNLVDNDFLLSYLDKLLLFSKGDLPSYNDLKNEFDYSSNIFLKNYLLQRSENSIFTKFFLKFFNLKPDDKNLIEDNTIKRLSIAKSYLYQKDIDNSLAELRKINYNLDHFERWIEQASRFNESISIINFLENNLDNI